MRDSKFTQQISTDTSLKQSQQLKLTPQLQQQLQVLQLNQQDLEQAIEQFLEKNIMLNWQASDNEWENADASVLDNQANENASDSDITSLSDTFEQLPGELDIDTDWQEIDSDYAIDALDSSQSIANHEAGEFHEDWVADNTTFEARLEQAILTAPFDKTQRQIASYVLSECDERYFLTKSVQTLASASSFDAPAIQAVINIIKQLDPPGVASQNMPEYLLCQLHSLPECNDAVINAHEILSHYYEYIGIKPAFIKRRLDISDEEYQNALTVIRSLQPYPTSEETAVAGNIKPDVFVRQRLGVFFASSNPDARYDLAINETYANLTQKQHINADEKNFLNAQLQEAKGFLNALDKRYHTVLRVANAIVSEQQAFFIEGSSALKPLTMQTIAEKLDLNESTVSRAVNGKYLSFSNKLFELRTFFTQDLSSKSSDEQALSAENIKSIIAKLIDNEPADKPLSDAKIEKILKEQHIEIARRTVAKYRESMGIGTASARKKKI